MPTNTHVFETKMSKRMQASFIDKPVFRSFVNQEERAKLSNGEAVTRPYRSLMRGQNYTRNSSLSFQNIVETNETLTIATIKSVPFQIDDFDKAQSNFVLQQEWTNDATDEMKSIVDGNILAEVANSLSSIDAADFGGVSGDPLVLDSSNVQEVFFVANRKLRLQNVDVTGLDPRLHMKKLGMPGVGGLAGFAALSPHFHEVLETSEQNRETPQGDKVGKNGFMRQKAGFDLLLTNNSYWSAVLSIVTQPTNGDTVVIGGVSYQFVDSIGSAAGNILIDSSADNARANLTAAINDPSTTDANKVAVSGTRDNQYTLSDQEKMEDLTAVDAAGADTMTLTGEGISYYVLSETLTDTTDSWTKEVQHQLVGKKGCVDMVSQVGPNVVVSDIENGFGKKVKPRILYGKKSFLEGTRLMVDVQIDSSNWS